MNFISRYYSVNGRALRKVRLDCQLSQSELGKRAGYSERLVRKAESGGSLELETIQCLVEALRLLGAEISVEQLLYDQLAMAKTVVEGYDKLGPNMMKDIAHLLTPDFIWYCPGDPKNTPFAGEWRGANGLQEWLDIFFGTFTRMPGSLHPEYTVGNNHVCAHYSDTLYLKGVALPPFWVNLHFVFRNGLIRRIDDQYDTKAASESHQSASSNTTR